MPPLLLVYVCGDRQRLETQARLHTVLLSSPECLDYREMAERYFLGEDRTNSQPVAFIGSDTICSKLSKVISFVISRYPRTLLIYLLFFEKGNKGLNPCNSVYVGVWGGVLLFSDSISKCSPGCGETYL